MIEVGDYIRIKNGPIRRIIEINEGKEKTIFGKYRLDKDYNNCRSVAEKKIVKHSKNIIDLIEEDDIGIMNYNGMIFRKFITLDDILELKVVHYKLLRLVTKEQYKSVEYIVKEE